MDTELARLIDHTLLTPLGRVFALVRRMFTWLEVGKALGSSRIKHCSKNVLGFGAIRAKGEAFWGELR